MCSFQVRRGEQHRERTSAEHANDGRAAGADGIEDAHDVVHPNLGRGDMVKRHRIRHPRPPLVDGIGRPMRAMRRNAAAILGCSPRLLDVAPPLGHKDDVERARIR